MNDVSPDLAIYLSHYIQEPTEDFPPLSCTPYGHYIPCPHWVALSHQPCRVPMMDRWACMVMESLESSALSLLAEVSEVVLYHP